MAPQPPHRPRPRSRPRFSALLLPLAALLPAAALSATPPLDLKRIYAQLRRQGHELAKRFAPKRHDTPPAWAQRKDPPLATFAVIADPHVDDSGKIAWAKPTRQRFLKVCRFLNETIKPDAVLLLGDLIANENDPQQLRNVKALLDRHLKAPYLPVHGNHDGPGFESVFGPANATRPIAGIRFIALGLTFWHWDSGWGRYDRLPWLTKQLAEHRAEPTLILTHNPICMPTFANNADVLRLLDAQPQVLAVLAGHMHADYEMRFAKPHFGLPMFARPPHAIKVLRFHPDRILIFTYEVHRGTYRQANLYQRIAIPPEYRLRAARGTKNGNARGGAPLKSRPTAAPPAASRPNGAAPPPLRTRARGG